MTERNTLTKEQEAWLKALESGEYEQITKNLCMYGAYCCLGVATHVVDPKHHALENNGWDFEDYIEKYPHDDLVSFGDDESTAPPEVIEALRLNSSTGEFRFGFKTSCGRSTLVAVNDISGWTFPQIAEFIRAKPWLVFTNFDQPKEASK